MLLSIPKERQRCLHMAEKHAHVHVRRLLVETEHALAVGGVIPAIRQRDAVVSKRHVSEGIPPFRVLDA